MKCSLSCSGPDCLSIDCGIYQRKFPFCARYRLTVDRSARTFCNICRTPYGVQSRHQNYESCRQWLNLAGRTTALLLLLCHCYWLLLFCQPHASVEAIRPRVVTPLRRQKMSETALPEPDKAASLEICHVVQKDEVDALEKTTEEWIDQEGWERIPGEMEIVRFLDPTARYAGKMNGEVVTTIWAVNYDDSYCFIPIFITKKEFRGKGSGGKMLEAALEHAGDRVVSLYAPKGVIKWYAKHGFRAYARCRGCKIDRLERFKESKNHCIVEAICLPASELADFDERYFPVRREKFLQKWIRLPRSYALAYVEDGKIVGYGVVHRCSVGRMGKIGPLFANSFEVARDLIVTLLSTVSHLKEVRFETLENNPHAKQLAAELDMRLTEVEDVMCRHGRTDVEFDGIYAITSDFVG